LAFFNRGHIHRDRQLVLAATLNDAADGADVVVAAPGQRDVTGGRNTVVGRVQVNPTRSRTVDEHSGVRSVGSNESFTIGWSNGLRRSTDIPRRQTDGARQAIWRWAKS